MATTAGVLTVEAADSPTPSNGLAPRTTGTEDLFAEILAGVLDVEQVSVEAHFFEDLGADSMVMARFCARVRKNPSLPPVSIKDVYQHPTVKSLAGALSSGATAAPSPTHTAYADILAAVLSIEHVSGEAHFFEDLGADSMVMARFCARVRKNPGLPPVSIKDVYAHPSIARLAAALENPASEAAAALEVPASEPAAALPAAEPAQRPRPASTAEFVLCGALQILAFLAYAMAAGFVATEGYKWISSTPDVVGIYLRSAAVGGATFLVVSILPIVVKWLLIGRWKPRQIRIWSLAYVRFWVVKTLVQANPVVRFCVGSPLYVLYLRALGAKIGRDVLIVSRHVPVCTDLLTIGDGSVIRKDAFFNCYRAEAGVIQTGTVSLGRGVVVGETSVLDIDTSMADGSQLGHSSSLHAGQAVPRGAHWHGSPAEPTSVDYQLVPPLRVSTGRKVFYSLVQLLKIVFVNMAFAFGLIAILFVELPWLASVATDDAQLFEWSLYRNAALTALAAVLVLTFGGLLFVSTVPRLLGRLLRPDRVYSLYGFHYGVNRLITKLTNGKTFKRLFGDSSFIVPYLQSIGYRLAPVLQTGSNFGNEVQHDSPFQVSVGHGTQCASQLSIVNALYSNSSFRIARASIGRNNFLGNLVSYPALSRTGDNCLLGTKVLVPIEGPVRKDVGLLGSPSFEIPRTVHRDSGFEKLAQGAATDGRLRAKNRHNLASMGMFLLSRWIYLFVLVIVLAAFLDQHVSSGFWAATLGTVFLLLFTLVHGVITERAGRRFRDLQPRHCSIYHIDFWRMERFFKLASRVHAVLNGTPFKGFVWRLLGLRVGKRLYDDGCGMAEKNMVTIGDDVTLNAGSGIQCHTQEDYAFKSDHISVGSGVTIGVGALVHYGAVVGDGAVLAPDSFLMKGGEVPAHARWGGNPAREMGAPAASFTFAVNGHGDNRHTGRYVGRHRSGTSAAALVNAE